MIPLFLLRLTPSNQPADPTDPVLKTRNQFFPSVSTSSGVSSPHRRHRHLPHGLWPCSLPAALIPSHLLQRQTVSCCGECTVALFKALRGFPNAYRIISKSLVRPAGPSVIWPLPSSSNLPPAALAFTYLEHPQFLLPLWPYDCVASPWNAVPPESLVSHGLLSITSPLTCRLLQDAFPTCPV